MGIEYKRNLVPGPAGVTIDTDDRPRLALDRMDHSRRNPIRTGLTAGLSLLMLTLSVAIPVLEQGTLLHHPVVESEHAPGDCPSGHDHTICTQVGANLAVEGDDIDAPLAGNVLALEAPRGALTIAARADEGARRSRAPPLA